MSLSHNLFYSKLSEFSRSFYMIIYSINCSKYEIQKSDFEFRDRLFAKNITEIKFFIKELNGKNRFDRNTYILVRNYRECSSFCDFHLTE